jgi:hypothetical protein
MATLHINVSGQPEISGTIPLPLVPRAITTYTCPLGAFLIGPAITVQGSGSNPTILGSFMIENVGDNYGLVTFSGTFIRGGGNGTGSVYWNGTHPPKGVGGSDTWTSDTTTPKPKLRPRAKAKTQGR